MTEEIRREKYSARVLPAPLTVAELRKILAKLPDDATLRYNDYKTPEYHDWYTDVTHVVGITEDGVLQLGSNADYLVDDRFDFDEDDEDEVDEAADPQQAEAPAAPRITESGLIEPLEALIDDLIAQAHEQTTLDAYDAAMAREITSQSPTSGSNS